MLCKQAWSYRASENTIKKALLEHASNAFKTMLNLVFIAFSQRSQRTFPFPQTVS